MTWSPSAIPACRQRCSRSCAFDPRPRRACTTMTPSAICWLTNFPRRVVERALVVFGLLLPSQIRPGGRGRVASLDGRSFGPKRSSGEVGQVQVLVDALVPRYFASASSTALADLERACATGEEPLTIAMAERSRLVDRGRVEIIASDGSPAALARLQGNLSGSVLPRLPPLLREMLHRHGQERVASVPNCMRVRWCRANLQNPDEVAPSRTSIYLLSPNVLYLLFRPTRWPRP